MMHFFPYCPEQLFQSTNQTLRVNKQYHTPRFIEDITLMNINKPILVIASGSHLLLLIEI